MNDIALARVEKTSAMLVTFTFGGTPTVLRYTDWTAPIVYLGRRYDPIPEISIDLPANTGGLKEDPLIINMPLNAFSARLANGEPHPVVSVEVVELVGAEADSLAFVHHRGIVETATRGAAGKPNRVRLKCINAKQRMGTPLGVIATAECSNVFGDNDCFINLGPLRETATIVAIDKTVITTSGLATTATPGYWHRGDVLVDGLSLKIRDYIAGEQMVLVREPPRTWLGQVATFTPGCDGELGTCIGRWANEANYRGLGIAMPAYHPLIEAP